MQARQISTSINYVYAKFSEQHINAAKGVECHDIYKGMTTETHLIVDVGSKTGNIRGVLKRITM